MNVNTSITVVQNLASLVLTQPDLQSFDATLDALDQISSRCVVLSVDQRKSIARTGERSELFCRQALNFVSQNPEILPRGLSMDDAIADLAALDQLRPRLARLTKIVQRFSDTEAALGSDVMVAALNGYRMLKATGQIYGLAPLERELRSRFTYRAKSTGEAPPAPKGNNPPTG